MSTLAITGGNGFVGRGVIERLSRSGTDFVQLGRKMREDGVPEWRIERPVDVIIHAAGRVHVMNEAARDPLVEFRKVNVEGTLGLARLALEMKCRRFVFISSVKVNGESTRERPFTCADVPAPLDPYGISKCEAEAALFALSRETGLEVVIVRPPLVYGPGVGANFLKLMKLVRRGLPLPLGGIDNRRSMVALENLVDFLLVCAHHANAPGQTFLVSDDKDVSTSELLRMLAEAMGKRSMLFPVPSAIIAGAAALLGRSPMAERLLESLQVDVGHSRSTLGWKPVTAMPEALAKTVAHFLTHYG